jgi:hypothetical protein
MLQIERLSYIRTDLTSHFSCIQKLDAVHLSATSVFFTPRIVDILRDIYAKSIYIYIHISMYLRVQTYIHTQPHRLTRMFNKML